ncbi:hypothetical protein L1987_38795 [Smallanthus sonchifolius]|uniref:Uncharacterized protein n=1 Tax=Smallanthus sonchifolius TaxID=185202 RepID=A0ACB9HKX7_9ASTR|nr:hypothetical protein L1987_38795 [Smallanthus sonchifolius]
MKFADYFGRAFSSVSASQFPWVKLFRESPVAKVADNPVSHISEAVYKTSVDWINKHSMEALGSFLLWSLDNILTDLASQLGGPKGSKKGAQKTSSKSQVCLFVVLAIVLRRKPDALVTILPTLNETPKYNGQDKLPLIVWMVTQVRCVATERFEVVYPTLKKVALAGSPGSKAMKQVYQQIMTISLKASGEGIPELSNEASNIFIWCLTQNPDCCKQWDMVYLDNLEASIIILRRLNEQWKELSLKQSFLEALTETLRSLKRKNVKAMAEGDVSVDQALYKEADKYCKVLLGRLSRGWRCIKATVFLIVAFGVGAAFLTPTTLESLDLNRLSEIINIQKFI